MTMLSNIKCFRLSYLKYYIYRGINIHLKSNSGLQRMMEIASEMEEIKYESSMEITENTSPNVAVVLGKIFDNMYYDLARERFTTKIEEFIQ